MNISNMLEHINSIIHGNVAFSANSGLTVSYVGYIFIPHKFFPAFDNCFVVSRIKTQILNIDRQSFSNGNKILMVFRPHVLCYVHRQRKFGIIFQQFI